MVCRAERHQLTLLVIQRPHRSRPPQLTNGLQIRRLALRNGDAVPRRDGDGVHGQAAGQVHGSRPELDYVFRSGIYLVWQERTDCNEHPVHARAAGCVRGADCLVCGLAGLAVSGVLVGESVEDCVLAYFDSVELFAVEVVEFYEYCGDFLLF